MVLKRGDAFELDIAAAKTADVRALLQKDYEAFLPRIKKAEADTDEQCDSLSDSDLDIVARESTLRAAALGGQQPDIGAFEYQASHLCGSAWDQSFVTMSSSTPNLCGMDVLPAGRTLWQRPWS